MQSSIQASISHQTNELKNMMASFFQMNIPSTLGLGSLPSNTVVNPKGELKAITTRSGLALDGPSVPMPFPFINPEEDERKEETLTDPKHGEFTIKVSPPPVQKAKPPSQRNFVVHQRDPRHPHIPYHIHKFWQMFKQLHVNISLANALILISKYQKILKILLSNKEKLLEMANTPLSENCSAVILKKLPEKLGDPGKFLISCGFSELKCKALANLGASINLMPLSVWKKLGLPELISTRMTFELANREICTPVGIARDVFVPVGKFTFPADFVIVDYESDPRVPLILGRLFLQTARALIDVHREEMILRDSDERGNPTFSSEPNSDLTSPEVKDDIFDPEGGIFLIEKLLNLDSTKDLPFSPLSGSTTSSSSLTTSEISDYSLEEFPDELALIVSFPPGNDDMTPEDVIREIEYLLNHNQIAKYSPNNDLVDNLPEMFIDEHTLDYSSPPLWDDNDDKLFDLENINDDCDSVFYEDFSEVDTLSSPNNEDKVFNPGILIHENHFEVTNCATMEKNVKKTTNASLILKDFNPPLYELPFHKEVLRLGILLSFSSENEENVFNPGILTSKRVHTSLLLELSHRDSKAFKVIKIFESPMEIFPCSYGEDIHTLDVLCLHFYPP
ncbi:reverse transcriptase domain-containing protein [Tanacetum coccineum]